MNLGGVRAVQLESDSRDLQQQTLKAMVAAGFSYLRLDVAFPTDEPEPGQYRWPQTTLIQQAVQDGLGIDAILDYAPPWARTPDGGTQPADYAEFASAAARHLAPLGVHAFELGNEPNRPGDGSRVHPAEYARDLMAAYPAIKAVDPAATVLVGGLADADDAPDGNQVSPATFLQALYTAGAGADFDGVAVHPSTAPAPPMYPAQWNAFYTLPALHQVSVRNGFGRTPIWITEFGAPTADSANAESLQRQATDLPAAYRQARSWSWVAGFFFFEWQDEPLDGGDWGLTTASGDEKPAFQAVARALGADAAPQSVPSIEQAG